MKSLFAKTDNFLFKFQKACFLLCYLFMLSQISFPGLDVTAAELYFAALQTGTAHLDLKKRNTIVFIRQKFDTLSLQNQGWPGFFSCSPETLE